MSTVNAEREGLHELMREGIAPLILLISLKIFTVDKTKSQ